MGSARKYTPEVIEFLRQSCDMPIDEIVRLLEVEFGLKISRSSLLTKRNLLGIKRTCHHRTLFSKEIGDFIRAHNDEFDNKVMADIVNKKFGKSFSELQVRLWRWRRGLKFRLFCKEAIEYMRSHSDESFERLRLDVNRIFGRSYTRQQIKSACHYYKLKKFEESRKKGCAEFTERKKNGSHTRVEIKVGEKWIPKARYIYEQATGRKVQKDEVMIFLDGDIFNFELSNLVCAKKNVVAYVNRHLKGTCRSNAELTKCKYDIAGLKMLVAERERELKKGGGNNEQQD